MAIRITAACMHADIDERLTMDLASTQAHLDVLYQYYMQYCIYSNTTYDPIRYVRREGLICAYSIHIGLSIALKAERGIPDWLWGAVAQWSEHLQLKQEALGSIPSGCPGFFLFQLAYTDVNGMKDLWCSSTVRLLSTQI